MNPSTPHIVRRKPALTWTTIGVALWLAGCATATFPAPGAAPAVEAPAGVRPVNRSVIRERTADAYYHYAAAQLKARQDRLQDALGELRQAIKHDPETALLWVQLAQWLLRTGDMPGALEAAQKAVALDPARPPARLTLADLFRRQKLFTDAERELEQAIAQDPQSQDAYLALAQQHFEQKAYDKARAVLLRLTAVRPDDAQVHYLLGRGAVETEKWDEAIAELKRATEIDPDHDASWSALGYVYETRNQPDEAVKTYKQAIKANPGNAGFIERLGDLLVRLGRLGEAQEEIESLAESLPRDPRVWMKLGAIHYEQKHWNRAVSAFRQAVLLEPSNLRTRYFLSTALIDAGKDDEARIELDKVLRADPRSVDARIQLGFLYGRAKRYDEAITIPPEPLHL